MQKTLLFLIALFVQLNAIGQADNKIKGIVTYKTDYGIKPNVGGKVYFIDSDRLPPDSANILRQYPTAFRFYRLMLNSHGSSRKRISEILQKSYGIKTKADFEEFQKKAIRILYRAKIDLTPTVINGIGEYNITVPECNGSYLLFMSDKIYNYGLHQISIEDLKVGEVNYEIND